MSQENLRYLINDIFKTKMDRLTFNSSILNHLTLVVAIDSLKVILLIFFLILQRFYCNLHLSCTL